MGSSGTDEPEFASTGGDDPSPLDSGSKTVQLSDSANAIQAAAKAPQLSQVAECVSQEATGLVTLDPGFLQSWGAQRLLTSYANEQAASSAALRRDMKEAQALERHAAAEVTDLRAELKVAQFALSTERKLRAPRTLFSLLGLSVAGFGVDQFGADNTALGVILVAIGAAIVVGTHLLGPSNGDPK
jgi:hypothetical protein